MPEISLDADTGRPTGSRAAGRLRAAGKIPGVVYGHGIEPLPVAVDHRALRAALTTEAGLNALLQLRMGGRRQLAMAKDVQRDPVRGTVSHVDFLVVGRDEVVAADVPVTLVGEATAVVRGDGVIDQALFTLALNAKATNVPTAVEVDVSRLGIGDTVRVGDLRLPDGVTTDVDPEQPVVVGQPPQVRAEDLLPEGVEPSPPSEEEAAADSLAEELAEVAERVEALADEAQEHGGADAGER